MRFCFITFRSVTHAQRGERLLQTEDIRCTLRRTPRWMEAQGCGYSLRLRSEDAERGAEVLRRGGVPMRKVYIQREDGTMEELAV